MKKTFKVVMLPTEKASYLQLRTSVKPHHPDFPENSLALHNYADIPDPKGYWFKQHLYIISDEEPKVDDWCIGGAGHFVCKCVKKEDGYIYHKSLNSTGNNYPYYYKKIIATTDKSLEIEILEGPPEFSCEGVRDIPLPQLPESFIKAYIKAYNEGKPITEVDLEMEYNLPTDIKNSSINKVDKIVKTRPDNTVIVHQSKMYSRDEVIKFILEAPDGLEIHKWIEENL